MKTRFQPRLRFSGLRDLPDAGCAVWNASQTSKRAVAGSPELAASLIFSVSPRGKIVRITALLRGGFSKYDRHRICLHNLSQRLPRKPLLFGMKGPDRHFARTTRRRRVQEDPEQRSVCASPGQFGGTFSAFAAPCAGVILNFAIHRLKSSPNVFADLEPPPPENHRL